MAENQTPWFLRTPKRWQHFRSVPFSRMRILLLAAFVLFSTWGLFSDLIAGGHDPYLVVLFNMAISGALAVVWILSFARLPLVFLVVPVALQFTAPPVMNWFNSVLIREFSLKSVDGGSGIRVCAVVMMAAITMSYIFFVTFIRMEGKESFKLRTELELAHGIQKTLVPPFTLRTARFEIHGISQPSEKVGGDLVDAVALPGGDAIAYVADIAGHGLQAGILMGMLKTATRAALLDAGEREPHRTLPVLLDRLNTLLPEVKEPQMYATFTGFRLGADGSVFYALAASPPILQWHAGRRTLSHTEEPQFPLGLLPVTSFDGKRLETAPDDLLVVATDGILEVCNKPREEFGVERLKEVIAANANDALPQLAGKILAAARGFGRQLDDQTILIVRCL